MNLQLFHSELYRWYDTNKRTLPWRETNDPYKIWISEIILQQTRVIQGLDYYMRWTERFPDARSVADANEDEVLRYWQGLGYYARARNIYKAAIYIRDHYNAMGQAFPRTWDELRQLPGIGDYTAGAIASFAYNLPYPAMDGNVYRVLSRLTDCDIAFDTSAGKRHFHQVALQLLDMQNPRLFNSAIMEFGALQCVPQQPDCATCPLAIFCLARAHNTVELLPVRKPTHAPQDRYMTYTIYLAQHPTNGRTLTLIHQRQDRDIWQHLWEFVLTDTAPHPSKENATSSMSTELTHVLSHQRIHARFIVRQVNVLPEIVDHHIIYWDELDQYALSRMTLRALENLKIMASSDKKSHKNV